MHRIKSLSQQNLSLVLALYIGIFLNISVFYRRFSGVDYGIRIGVLSFLTEVIAVVLFTFFLLRVNSLGGKLFFRILSTLLVLISVAASYYMTFFNVVIGYGIVASVMTTDLDLTNEVIGYHLFIWMALISALPLLFIWAGGLRFTLLEQLKIPGQRVKSLLVVAIAGLLVWLPLGMVAKAHLESDAAHNLDMPSYGGMVAHSYLPSNWLTALGLLTYAKIDESRNHSSLLDPANKYHYEAAQGIDDTYVIFIIGETTRWDHMGMLGYKRDTTPFLEKEKNIVAFKGTSCDTSTKLSLRCMFVREGGAANNPQRTLKEQNVFAVLKSLGFTSELFAMQSEVWFYNQADANSYAFRELIASEKRNDGKAVDDMLLVNELQESLKRYPAGKHLVVLHTKGSHYLYSQRYTRDFARYMPECKGIDAFCTKEQLINAFDNSVLYTDAFIDKVLDQVRDKKAIVFYAADHGESIDENAHFHGTPREMAPQEQFRVPMIVWASDKYLKDPQQKAAFAHLKAKKRAGVTYKHTQIFDSVLGCLGYSSPDGGIVAKNNWCAGPAK